MGLLLFNFRLPLTALASLVLSFGGDGAAVSPGTESLETAKAAVPPAIVADISLWNAASRPAQHGETGLRLNDPSDLPAAGEAGESLNSDESEDIVPEEVPADEAGAEQGDLPPVQEEVPDGTDEAVPAPETGQEEQDEQSTIPLPTLPMPEPEPDAPDPPRVSRPYTTLYYQDEPVREIYSFDYIDRTYHRITLYEDMAEVLDLLDGFQQNPIQTPECIGFLIVTGDGKYPVYLSGVRPYDDSKADRLIETCVNFNEAYSSTASWVAYLDIDKIAGISFEGLGGYGYSLYNYPTDLVFQISLDTRNTATINTVGAFLKNLEVAPFPKIYSETVANMAPDSYYALDIELVNGVVYHIFGYDEGICISSSDSAETVVYGCTQNQVKAMRDMMAELRGVSLTDV